MELRTLGRTGVKVSSLCLGAMMFGEWGNTDHEDSVRIIHWALDAGINFIDTADVYSAGESEEIVGQALKGHRDDVVLATKFHASVGPGPNDRGNHRKHIFRAVEDSLRRLDTDFIDLYQAHRPDPATDVEETLGALTDLVHQGKVRWIGSSTFPPSAIVEAQCAAERRNLERFVCEQPPYSILVRDAEREVLPTAAAHRMGVIVWSPLAGGWLSGKYRKGRPVEPSGRAARIPDRFNPAKPENQAKFEIVESLVPVAEGEGIALPVLGVAWTLVHPAVTSAIVGPRTPQHLEDLLAAADVELSAETLDAIDAIVPPGHTLNRADLGYENVWLRPERRRRASSFHHLPRLAR
jgi:aryl-alcohol dehydrogenase-like predicted oxidoreductase